MAKRLVIVADPNDATRELLDEVLRTEFDVHVTKLGATDALESMLGEARADLVVAEIGPDRVAAVPQFQALRQQYSSVPFLLLVSHGAKAADDLQQSTGADRVLSKPFDLDELVGAARDLLGHRRRKTDTAAD